jgi:1,4-alpha-glucan branching enzyme
VLSAPTNHSLSSFELHLHSEGTHHESYRMLGAHLFPEGVRFAVWAPNAEQVSVIGNFNEWDRDSHPMQHRDGGVWELFIPGLAPGEHYKYCVTAKDGLQQEKADPYAFFAETTPRTASIVWPLFNHVWNDAAWMESRAHRNVLREPVSVYEVHLESWMRKPTNESLTYRELADQLVPYVRDLGYTHL